MKTRHPISRSIRRSLLADVRAVVEQAVQPLRDQMAVPPGQLLTPEQAASWLNVSLRTLDSLCAGGEIKPIWIKGARRFAPAALNAYAQRQSRRAA